MMSTRKKCTIDDRFLSLPGPSTSRTYHDTSPCTLWPPSAVPANPGVHFNSCTNCSQGTTPRTSKNNHYRHNTHRHTTRKHHLKHHYHSTDDDNDCHRAEVHPQPNSSFDSARSANPKIYQEGSFYNRHTYLTHYGTEENIYEEILEDGAGRHYRYHYHTGNARGRPHAVDANSELMRPVDEIVTAPPEQTTPTPPPSDPSLSFEEEYNLVQSEQERVLEQLNLSVEAMLMPTASDLESDTEGKAEGDACSTTTSGGGSSSTVKECEDQLTDLLRITPADDLLSPVAEFDSGLSSGSSSSYHSGDGGGSLSRKHHHYLHYHHNTVHHHNSNCADGLGSKRAHFSDAKCMMYGRSSCQVTGTLAKSRPPLSTNWKRTWKRLVVNLSNSLTEHNSSKQTGVE